MTIENRKCNICDGLYPDSKHDFNECFSLDIEWDMKQMDLVSMDLKPKPCVKWVGGKTQILQHIQKRLVNKKFDVYHEPFVGGGSVLLMVISMLRKKEIRVKELIASDINWQLICMYNNIKYNPYRLMNRIDELYKSYDDANVVEYEKRHKCKITTLEDAIVKGKKYVYYYFREQYNKHTEPSIDVASLFIILNKLCFRGLYRAGKNGFNTPYGNYINPNIYDRGNIISLSHAFESVLFKHQSYEKIDVGDNDIVYMDPPYYPIRKNAFESYSTIGFDHDSLVTYTKKINNFMQSNSMCEFTTQRYKEFGYEKILCKRRINSKKPSDTDYEVIIFSKSLHLM